MAAGGPDAIVVGAGLAGLAAADNLERRGLRTVVLESEQRVGGRVLTDDFEGCRIELGAHYFTTRYRRFRGLVERFGLERNVKPFQNAFRTAMHRDGRWHHLDYERPLTWARYSALRPLDLASAMTAGAAGYLAGPRARFADVTTATAVDRRRLAQVQTPDAIRYFTSPTFEAFCGYRPEELSLEFLGMSARFRGKPSRLEGGLAAVPEALAAGLDVRRGQAVERVSASNGRATVGTREGEELSAPACVVAVPAPAAAKVLQGEAAREREFLAATPYAPTNGAYFRTREPVDRRGPDGKPLYMELIPPGERPGRVIHAVVFLDWLAPDGGLVLAAAEPSGEITTWDDEAVVARLREELEELHPGLGGGIRASRVSRWKGMVPAFPTGRAREVREFRRRLGGAPVDFAGDWLYGPMMESALASGEAAAERVATRLAA